MIDSFVFVMIGSGGYMGAATLPELYCTGSKLRQKCNMEAPISWIFGCMFVQWKEEEKCRPSFIQSSLLVASCCLYVSECESFCVPHWWAKCCFALRSYGSLQLIRAMALSGQRNTYLLVPPRLTQWALSALLSLLAPLAVSRQFSRLHVEGHVKTILIPFTAPLVINAVF